jgi:hypothetical protein
MEKFPLRCHTCEKLLHSKNTHRDLGGALCSRCRAVFDLPNDSETVKEEQRQALRRPVEKLPEHFRLVDEPGVGLRLSWRHIGHAQLRSVMFCVLWFGGLAAGYTQGFPGGELTGTILLCTIIYLAIGALLTYVVLARFFNTTNLVVSSSELRTDHSPIPWPGIHPIPRREIKQVFCRQRSRTRRKNRVHFTYDVYIQCTDGTEQILVEGLIHANQAIFIEQLIERRLELVDTGVEGELALMAPPVEQLSMALPPNSASFDSRR